MILSKEHYEVIREREITRILEEELKRLLAEEEAQKAIQQYRTTHD